MQKLRKKMQGEGGFTLIELLIVIVILGILAAVVVFAVSGITDRGQDSACAADKNTLEVAQEASFAQDNTYRAEAALQTDGFIREQSTLYDTDATGAVTTADAAVCP